MTVPQSQQAAVVPDGGLLAVHAHPDDETLATGALLATWARAGEPVTVVTCTRGERGEVIDTPAHPTGVGHLEGDGPALAAFREQTLGETRIVGKFNSAYPVDGQIGAVTAKGNGLVEPVQLVIASLIENGQYDAVLERWGQTEEAVTESLINPPGLPKP